MKKITLIEGEGIGPEISQAVVRIFEAANVPIEWERENAGQITLDQKGELIPKSLLDSIKKNKVALKGPIGTPLAKGYKSVNVQLRQMFDLYQNLRPCKSTVGIETRFDNVDLVLFRENTEDLYAGLEYVDERLGISDSIARISRDGCYRIVKAAFEYAKNHGRKKVTLVHKANILKSAGRLFLEAGEEVKKDYPGVEADDKIVDNMCMQLVTKPEKFDVIVTTNLFGDILSDLCAGLVGGLGVVAGANIGETVSVYEAVHGTAPDIAGKGIANPTAMLRSAILMLNQLGMKEYGEKIDRALNMTFQNKVECTPDLGGKASTQEYTENIIKNLNR